MKLWKKIVIGLVGLFILLFAGLLIAAQLLITPERVRESVVPLVHEATQRDLTLGDIDISLFSGIALKDVVLADQSGDKPFVAVDRAVLRYRLWPLLLLRVELDELRLEKPQIHITRFKDGRFNFSDLTGDGKKTAAAADNKSTPAAGKTSGTPLDLRVSQIVIRDGVVLFDDESTAPPQQQSVSAITLDVQGFSTSEPFPLKFAADWNGNQVRLDGRFDLDDLSADTQIGLNAINLRLQGDLLADVKGERLRARIGLPPTAAGDLISSLPRDVVKTADLPRLEGRLSADVVLDGLIDNPTALLQSATLTFDALGVRSGDLHTVLNGALTLDHLALAGEALRLVVNDQPLTLSARIADILQQPLAADLALSGQRFDLDKLIPPPAQEAAEAAPTSAGKETMLTEIGPFDLPLALKGTATLDTLLYRGLELRQAELRFTLVNNLLRLERLGARVGDGEMGQSGQVDLTVRGLRYTSNLDLKQVPVNPFVKAFKPKLGDSIFGTVTGRVSLGGAGTLPEAIKKNLSGDGRLELKQAKLVRMPTLDSAAALLGVAELKEVVIDDGTAVFKLAGGSADIDLQTIGPQLRQTTRGTVSLAGQLGLRSDLALSPELSKRLDRRSVLGGVLTDKEGWSHLPLVIKGPAADPKVALDMKAVKKQAAESAVDDLKQKLLKKLGGDKQPAGTPAEQPAEQPTKQPKQEAPADKLIDKALKGLFKN